MRGLLIVVVGALIAAPGWPKLFGFDQYQDPIAWFGVALSIFGGIVQFRDALPFEWKFVEDDWRPFEGSYRLIVARRSASKRNAR